MLTLSLLAERKRVWLRAVHRNEVLVELVITHGICETSDVSTSSASKQILLKVVGVIIFWSEWVLLHEVAGCAVVLDFLRVVDGSPKAELLGWFPYLPLFIKKLPVSHIIFVWITERLCGERWQMAGCEAENRVGLVSSTSTTWGGVVLFETWVLNGARRNNCRTLILVVMVARSLKYTLLLLLVVAFLHLPIFNGCPFKFLHHLILWGNFSLQLLLQLLLVVLCLYWLLAVEAYKLRSVFTRQRSNSRCCSWFLLLLLRHIRRFPHISELKDVGLVLVLLLVLSELKQLLVVASLVLSSELIIVLFFVPLHMGPLCADVLHDIWGGPLCVQLLHFLAKLLREVDVGREWLLRPRHVPFSLHVRTYNLFIM